MSLLGILKRGAAVVLTISYLGTQCLFAYQPEKGFWAERRKATRRSSATLLASLPHSTSPLGSGSLSAQFHAVNSLGSSLSQSVAKTLPKRFLKENGDLLAALSPAYGTVRKVSFPTSGAKDGPVVIHIQDVHMNPEAQWNIRETVRTLLQTGQVGLVALEGATEEIDLQPFVDFPYRKAVESTANFLLKQNKITGPIHAALTASGKLPEFRGIDDPVHYQANVQAYKDAAPRLEKMREDVKILRAESEREKSSVFSPPLMTFDQKVQAYRAEKISLGDYVGILLGNENESAIPASLRHFSEALKMERTLNFSQVELERAHMIERLTPKLTPEETSALLAESVAYRSGQLTYADFYKHLKETCQKKGLALTDFPALDAYVRYVLLADGIDAEGLLEDISLLEKQGYDRLAKTAREKDLISRSRDVWLKGKLVEFSLTPLEWKEYDGTISGRGGEDLLSFESFYREADARDGAMGANLLKAVGTKSKTVSILVTGGYHAEGVTKKLKENGITVISYVPKIDKINTAEGSSYLSVFTQEKTPLEQLFSGDKLFLGINPVAAMPEAAVIAESETRLANPGISKEALAKLSGYLERFHPGVKLTLEDPQAMPDGGWMAVVHVQVGDRQKGFTLITDKNFDIKSFGVNENEARPPFAWLMDILLPVHQFLKGNAGKVSKWTEALFFASLSSWTPANLLWFARRHSVENPQKLTFLMAWMALNSVQSKPTQEKSGFLLRFLNQLKEQFKRHEFWNGLELITLAMNKKSKGDFHKGKKQRNPPHREALGFKELKLVDDREEILNGRREVVGRILVFRNGRYLLLKKKEKYTGKMKLDVPGGGASGEVAGVSHSGGLRREAKEELHVDLKKYLKSALDLFSYRKRDKNVQIFSIPGPNGDPLKRRATTFHRVALRPNELIHIKVGAEHEGSDWMALPQILENKTFESLNTGPKMAFYLEFLREAYGIVGVKSLLPLNQSHRLKRLTDPVLIQTVDGGFLFSGPNDMESQQALKKLHQESKMGTVLQRKRDKKSLLNGWENPMAVSAIGSQMKQESMIMRIVGNIKEEVLPPGHGDEDQTDVLMKFKTPEKKKGSLRTDLVASLPKGQKPISSIRLLIKTSNPENPKYGFVGVMAHKDECLGGTGEEPKKLIERLRNRLGIQNAEESFGVKDSPLIFHSIERPDGVEYRAVYDGTFILEDENGGADGITKGLRRLNYKDMKATYFEFTLSARKVILKEIVKTEYGFTVRSIKPLSGAFPGGESSLLLETEEGDFVLRKANINLDDEKKLIKVKKRPDGTNGFYFKLGQENYVLVSRSKNFHLQVPKKLRKSLSPSLPQNEMGWVRELAQRIKKAEIWAELLAERESIAEQKKENPEIFNKPNKSPVTRWDYRLQLAFLKLVKQNFPSAHVVGEEDLLNERFLKSLSESDRGEVKGLLLRNGETRIDDLIFFVDPIDGTRSFTDGTGNNYAFTFGVLINGKRFYAATYLPDSQDLYEADAVNNQIYKNGEIVSRSSQSPFSLLKVQRAILTGWNRVYSRFFNNVSPEIPSIALVAVHMAADEPGSASELLLNTKIHPWDSVPAAIFLSAAGFSVTTHKGHPFFPKLLLWLSEGKSPESFQSSFLAARKPSLSPLVKQTRAARKSFRSQINDRGRATGWMGVGIAWGMGWGVGLVRKWIGKAKDGENPSSYGREFVSWNRGINASRSEDGVNAVVSVTAGWVAGQSWLGMALDPSLLLVGVWFLLLVASHYEKKQIEGKKSSIEKWTGQAPSFRKAIQLFGFYLLPLLSSVYMGAASVPAIYNVLMVLLYLPFLRLVHDQMNDEKKDTLGGHGTFSNVLFPSSAAYWFARWSGKDAYEAFGFGRKWIFLEWVPLIGLTLMGALSSDLGIGDLLWFGIDPVLGPLALLGHFAIAWGRFEMMARVEKMQGESPPAVGSVTRYLILFGLFLVPGGLFIGPFVNFVVAIFQWDADARVPSTKTPWSMEITRKGYQIHLIDSDHSEGSKDKWLSVRAVITRIGPDGEIHYLLVKNPSDRWEVPGGGKNSWEGLSVALKRELVEELGEEFANKLVGFLSEKDQSEEERTLFVHDLLKPNGKTEYRSVHVQNFDLKKSIHPSVRLNEESLTSRWLSYERMKIELPSFTLATRMSFLPEVFLREFGIEGVVSMSPLSGEQGNSINQSLLVKTKTENFVFRKAGNDMPEAVFNAEVQSHLYENGIPVRELIKRKVPGEREDDFVLRLGNVPFVLERYGDEGESVDISAAGEKHYIALGGLAAQVQNALKNFPKNLSPDRIPPRVEEMEYPTVLIGLCPWNVGFSSHENGSVSVSRIRELTHPFWGDRVKELITIALKIKNPRFFDELVTAYASRIGTPLNKYELRSLAGVSSKADMREKFQGHLDAKAKAKELSLRWIENARRSPSSLSRIWMNLPSHVGILDDLLRKAPWESVVLVVAMGGAVMSHLLAGSSILWVMAASLLAGVLGYSHTWGTYGFVNGKIQQVKPRSMDKVLSWWFWTSIFGAVLMGVGQVVPYEALGWGLGGGTWMAAWAGKFVHQRGNREWVVNHLDNGNLTPAQKNIAREILMNLEQRPIRLGVDEFRAMVLQTAEAYSRRAGSVGMGSAQVHPHPLPGPLPRAGEGVNSLLTIDLNGNSSTASLGEGIQLYFVDPVAVRSAVGIENLQSIMKKDEKIYLVAQNAIEGLPSDRVIVAGGAFQSVGGKEKPLFEVSLGAVKGVIFEAVKGQAIRILKTPLLNLNAAGLDSDDPLALASKNAIVLILESLRGFPSDVLLWDDVWQVYRALAEAA